MEPTNIQKNPIVYKYNASFIQELNKLFEFFIIIERFTNQPRP